MAAGKHTVEYLGANARPISRYTAPADTPYFIATGIESGRVVTADEFRDHFRQLDLAHRAAQRNGARR
ncbi:hypothetical protein WKY82_20180 [Gordonia malaquae]|uniref:hypothetical protein n=1 Tax=Gordonia malaquae TaxID=410332 RepID=UPI0030C79B65